MSLLRVLYPCLLSGVNVGVGWLLYQPLESTVGLVLLLVGLLVSVGVLTQAVGGTPASEQ
ncbi:hypothetical protein [Haloarcula litorea]|uniref:hypothetical protein n=1 Tax=Haloarcula litorea TaxID=3032579 RepID=UPI0023E8427D|nr:hypothetical protein [Halomicroarcula sp. GDY20]